MVRIPSLSRRAKASPQSTPAATPAPTRDENRDGRIDERDARPVADATGTAPLGTERTSDRAARTGDRVTSSSDLAAPGSDRATYRSASAGSATATAPVSDRPRADETQVDGHPRIDDRPGIDDRPTDTRPADRAPTVVAPAGPRPRASLLATLSLIFGVAAAMLVLSGTLAGYGIALGTLASLLGIAGISATSRRHVAGKSDALLGLVFGLGAVIVGILAMTGQFTWPTTDGDTVLRFREWLDTQFVDRF